MTVTFSTWNENLKNMIVMELLASQLTVSVALRALASQAAI
jgi:hypothetical protein